MRSGILDLSKALTSYATWIRLGVRDVYLQYSRAGLGIVWPIANVVVWIGLIYGLLGPTIGAEKQFFLSYVAVGMVLYNYALSILSGGIGALIKFRSQLLNLPIPVFGVAMRHVSSSVFVLLLQCVVVAFCFVYDGITFSPDALWLFLLLPALVFSSIFLCAGLMAIGAYSGDFIFFIQSVMRVMMIATPIFWYVDSLSNSFRILILNLNPLAGILDIVRYALGLGVAWKLDYLLAILVYGAFSLASFLFYLVRFNTLRKII